MLLQTCGQFESLGVPLGSAITEALELYNAAVNCLVAVFQMSTSVPAAKLHGITFHFTGGLKRQHGGDTVKKISVNHLKQESLLLIF